MRLNIRYKTQSSARNHKATRTRLDIVFHHKSERTITGRRRHYTCFDVNSTLLEGIRKAPAPALPLNAEPSRVISRLLCIERKKREKKTRSENPTLKANSNLEQSKNKIRMLKEIKMLHNKITAKMTARAMRE
jgi:hypothetical protein